MINSFQIQNFKCFKDFKAEGFERINLIGGKNNSGKSCLLEGIQCINQNLFGIAQQRQQESFLSLTNFKSPSNKIVIEINGDKENQIIIDFLEFSSDYVRNLTKFSTPIQYIKGNIKNPDYKLGTLVSNINKHEVDLNYSIVEILQIIDPQIRRIFGSANDNALSIQNSEFTSGLSDYGDAFEYLLNYFLPIFEKKTSKNIVESILLIDEVENGLHYTIHEDFWKNIFKLSKELNVQVFATTHSLEMIQAFNEVSKEEGEGAYFEMSREYGTNKIFAFKHDTELLTYELEKTESTLRGE